MDLKTEKAVDQLVAELTKPIFVLRLASGELLGGAAKENRLKSCMTRAANARQEILDIVTEFAEKQKE